MTLIKSLTVDFYRFFHDFKKTFRVPLVPCPNLVPGLSHAFCGTGKLLKRGRLAPVFVLVPLILQTKISFWGGLGVDNAPFVTVIRPVCITNGVQMGSIKAIL